MDNFNFSDIAKSLNHAQNVSNAILEAQDAKFQKENKRNEAIIKTAQNTEKIKNDVNAMHKSLEAETAERKAADKSNMKLGIVSLVVSIIAAVAGIASLIVSIIE